MKKLYFLFVLALLTVLSGNSYGQYATYHDDSGWFFGLNAGSTYQRSDVKDRFGIGAGFTFGGSLTPREGRAFSLDLRLRGLWGVTHGQGYRRDYNLGNNAVYNSSRDSLLFPQSASTGSFYTDSLGYTYHNYRKKFNEWSLELVLNANRLRERTNILAYVYGGVGLTRYQTMTDQLGSGDTPYDYSTIDTTRSIAGIQSDLISLRDNDFETEADGSEEKQLIFVSSIGAGLGYQISPWFSVALEHKMSFSGIDLLDGVTGENSDKWYGNQDVYHYSGISLVWRIRRGGTVPGERPDPDIDNYTVGTPPGGGGTPPSGGGTTGGGTPPNGGGSDLTPPPPPAGLPPIVKITTPSACPIVVQDNLFMMRAQVLNVDNRNQITVTQNGSPNNSFTYQAATNTVTGNLVLKEGTNVFTVTGTNAFGTDTKTCVITYERPVINTLPPPVVTITNPPSSPYVVQQPVFNVRATILNINGPQNVNFTVNGVNTQSFAYNPSTKEFSSTITLNEGANTVQITGTNTVGSDTKVATIIYEKEQLLPPPLVTITNPPTSPFTVNSSNFNVRATILNINGPQNVSFQVNGVNNQNFSYNTSSKEFSSNIVLNPGSNTVVITGTNSVGTDTKTATIIFQQINTLPPPLVTFTSPANGHNTTAATQNITATALNVASKNDLFLKLNGNPYTNFTFNLNTKGISIIGAPMLVGNNTVELTGVNTVGSDTKNLLIIRREETGPPPVVTITLPTTNPHTQAVAPAIVNATVLNVPSRNNITVKVNGAATTAFGYNVSTKQLNLNLNLNPGSNVVEVSAVNNFGSDAKSTTLIFDVPCADPVVTITAPSINPQNTNKQNTVIEANITGISSAAQITFTVNGAPSTVFSYNPGTKKFSAGSRLREGSNTFVISARNECGTVSQSTVIIFTPQIITGPPPVVTFTNPTTDPWTTQTVTTTVNAKVLNVDAANQIVYKFNGVVSTNFTFDPGSKKFKSTVNLRAGQNTFEITATNPWGTDSKTTRIIFQEPGPPPVITWGDPARFPHTTLVRNLTLSGMIQNIDAKGQATLKINGVVTHDWTFNPVNKVFQINYTVPEGNTTYELRAENQWGTDQDAVVVIYHPPLPAPQVTFTNPPAAIHTVGSQIFTATGKVMHISAKQDMSVKVNGQVTTNFNYIPSTRVFTVPLTLNSGYNTVVVTATNGTGSDTKTVTINFNPDSQGGFGTGGGAGGGGSVPAPVITYQQPNSSPFTSPQQTGTIKGQITNITNPSQVTITLNGSPIQFGYSIPTKKFTAPVSLINGTNIFTVKAVNGGGTVTKSITLIYNAPPSSGGGSNPGSGGTTGGGSTTNGGTVSGGGTTGGRPGGSGGGGRSTPKPTVRLTAPASGSASTSATTYAIKANVTNVRSKSEVKVMLNARTAAFSYSNGAVSANVPLKLGLNTITISAGTGSNKVTKTIKITRTAAKVGGNTRSSGRGGR